MAESRLRGWQRVTGDTLKHKWCLTKSSPGMVIKSQMTTNVCERRCMILETPPRVFQQGSRNREKVLSFRFF